ncbi:hypothetical protein [Litorilituus lipolyticus]|uniref:hypothetical protein n=1 Tax=Litorilituus lipolyticus TaxID=2491017 RepID=UPI001478B651|nr:hypothetical protein [Litorilituus lipolyticus]
MALILPILLVIGFGIVCGGVLSLFHKDDGKSNWIVLPKSYLFVALLVLLIAI